MSGRDLFGRPLPTGAAPPLDPNEDLKREAFRRLKPLCVRLMGLASSPPTQNSGHAGALDAVRAEAATLPDAVFSPNLINYILLPLTATLRQCPNPAALPDAFLEAAFRLLSLICTHWRRAPNGMDHAAWEQLWRFAVAAVSIGEKGDKGKGRAVGEEARLEAVRFIAVLLDPALGVTPAMRRAVSGPKAPLVPTLFQSISLAVDAATPLLPHTTLQRAALKLLRILIGNLAGQSSLLASVLPGIVSAMAGAITREGKNLKGDIAAGMGGAMGDVVLETLDDDALRRLGVLDPEYTNIADLADDWGGRAGQFGDVEDEEKAGAAPKDPFPPLTKKYLSFTAQQLQTTVPPVLSALAAHTSHLARTAAGEMAVQLLMHCRAALPRLCPAALSTLLLLSVDDFEPVSEDASKKLQTLLAADIPSFDNTLVDLLSGAINSLPRLIRSQQDARIDEAARIVTAIAKSTAHGSGSGIRPNAIAAFLGPTGVVERWAWALLDCLEFGRPRGWSSTANTAARTAELGWNRGLITSALPLLIGSETEAPPSAPTFPNLSLRYVEAESTVRHLTQMLYALGGAGGEPALHSVDYFIRFAKAHRTRDVAKAVSAVWVAEALLRGIAQSHDEKRPPKAIRKMAREISRVLVAMDEEEDEDVEWEEPEPEAEASDALVERTKGVDQITTLLDRTPAPNSSAAHETQKLHVRAQRVLLSAVSLEALTSCAHILGTAFRPLLLHALYLVLAQLSSPHELVRQFAETALIRIAFDTGYASAQNLVLDNVDYVVNVVSQRLTYHRLSPHAPLVLIAMIRLVGAPIVPLVHDVVDEIFDALDDFHGYTALASALLAVLTTLIDAMADDPDAAVPTAEREATRADARRFLTPPDPAKDFANFAKWYAERGTRAQAEVSEILERAPQQPWGEDEEKKEEAPPPEPEETPPTRTQQVCTQILEKATFYLSHASPFLRARVLGLIERAIPVLANGGREGDLLPLIDRAWGSILARLDDSHAYVATEAAEVVASLAEHVGDYVSRRVADDAWPRLLRLLNAQSEADKRSALARRGAVGTITEHSISHRLHIALLRTARFIAAEVPVKDGLLWDMMLAFRPLLDARAHADLQAQARELYAALARRDEDALYVALGATTGSVGGLWAYLRDPGLDIGANARRVLV